MDGSITVVYTEPDNEEGVGVTTIVQAGMDDNGANMVLNFVREHGEMPQQIRG